MIITLAPPQNTTFIDLGTSSPKLGGVLNITGFINLTGIVGEYNDISEIILSDANNQLNYINLKGNSLTGDAKQYMPSNIEVILLPVNDLNEPLTDLSGFTQLRYIDCNLNGNMGGTPPLLPTSIVNCDLVNTGMSGNIPSLNSLTSLKRYRVTDNSLTGTIPSVSGNPLLENFQAHHNQLTGNLPDLSNCPNIKIFDVNNNQLTGYDGGLVATSIENIEWQDNLLPASAVNTILSECVATGTSGSHRTINVGGTGNAAPTGQGITDKNTLISRSWSVTTN